MKNKFYSVPLMLGGLMLAAGAAQAATIILDNHPSHDADYRTLQEAVDGASAGDTILVGPSYNGTSYGNAYVMKQLKIIGNGYLLEENGIETGAGGSIVGTINIRNGDSQNANCTSSPSGSMVAGVSGGIVAQSMSYPNNSYQCAGISGLTITRVKGFVFLYGHGSDSGASGYPYAPITSSRISNSIGPIQLSYASSIQINNNIITNTPTIAGHIELQYSDAVIYNNSSSQGAFAIYGHSSAEVFNNIGGDFDNAPTDSSVVTHHNFTLTPTVTESNVYTWTGSADAKYQLKTGSPAIGACNGADCGAFAGTTPYILSGLPPRPRITTMEFPGAVINSSTTMPVKVTAEGRN